MTGGGWPSVSAIFIEKSNVLQQLSEIGVRIREVCTIARTKSSISSEIPALWCVTVIRQNILLHKTDHK